MMRCVSLEGFPVLWLAAALLFQPVRGAETFSVATFNLENYLDAPAGTRLVKSQESRAAIRAGLRAMRPDVVALQEVGQLSALLELRESLRQEGLVYPQWEFVTGYDTNIHVAVLSRFPIVARRSMTNANFLLYGRRFRTSRGFSEIDIQVNPDYRVTVMAVHLKSRRPIRFADQADLREAEAGVLRGRIDGILSEDPTDNLVVLGDFNDVQNSPTVKRVMGRGLKALVDTRPPEHPGGRRGREVSAAGAPQITWTYHYGAEDTFSRFDYILVSRGMARECDPTGTYVLASPDWGMASDHRPLVARFRAVDD
ncbi:MAG: endonuclease/exonuclease/phosphatase family protein [Verrucomicrobia bacterium]|nr:endonuclease/exonuclease/phosphatase family protein [Verrucomicrobiota bacterium]